MSSLIIFHCRIEFDLQSAVNVGALLLSTVGKADDPHFPVHNPADCSLMYADAAGGPWKTIVNGTADAAATFIFDKWLVRCV